jgi:hypothetical protein
MKNYHLVLSQYFGTNFTDLEDCAQLLTFKFALQENELETLLN